MKRYSLVLSLLFGLLLVIAPLGCTKKAEEAKSFLEGQALLAKVPAEAAGIFLWDAENEAALAFQQTAMGKRSSLAKALENISAEALELPAPLSGLRNPEFQKALTTLKFKQVAGYLLPLTAGGAPDWGVFASAGTGADFTAVIPALKQSFNSTEWQVADLKVATAGFRAQLIGQNPPVEINCVTNGSILALGSSEKQVTLAFGPDRPAPLPLIQSPVFNELRTAVSERGSEYAFVYADTTSLSSALKQVPEGQELQKAAEAVRALSVSSRMCDKNPCTLGAVSIGKLGAEEQGYFDSLKSGVSTTFFNSIPADSAVLLTVSKGLIDALKKGAAASGDPEVASAALMSSAVDLEGLDALGVSVHAAEAGEMYPTAAIVARSNKAAELYALVKTQAGPALQMSGFFPGGLQEKTIEGVATSYAQSMMGVGIFLGQVKDGLLVTSSEKGAANVYRTWGSGKGLVQTLPAAEQKALADAQPFAGIYLDGNKLAGIAQQLSGTFAMFTGGQNALDEKTTNDIKAIGQVLGYVYVKPNQLRFYMGVLG